MSKALPDMLGSALEKVKELMDVNTVVGNPITTPEGVTILPVCKVSYGVGGGGSDFGKKTQEQDYPFGGGVGVGAKITPTAFLVIKGESVRLLPVGLPANNTADRIVEQVPELVDKLCAALEPRFKKNPE